MWTLGNLAEAVSVMLKVIKLTISIHASSDDNNLIRTGVMHFARNYTCGRTAFMGDIVQYTSPYLFPFVIEYSFIAAAVLIAMWKSVGKNPRCASHL